MQVSVIGLSYKTSPIEIREKIALSEEEIKEKLPSLISMSIREIMAISTCNRVEFYFWGDEKGFSDIINFLIENKNISKEEIEKYAYKLTSTNAVKHIFRVASSLDSMVLGEPQITGQVKDAYEIALKADLIGPFLDKLMSKALSVAKRVKTETAIGESAVSVSYAAVELAEKIFGELNTCTCTLVGAGEMAELAAKHMIDKGVSRLLVTNRTFERALALAKELNAQPIEFDKLLDAILDSDIVIVSTGAPDYIIKRQDVERIIKKRKYRSLFFIDISVPRNVDPEIAHLENVYLYDIDDLENIVEENRKRREKEAKKAEKIIEEETEKFMNWLKQQKVVPVIVAIREKFDAIRKSELEKTIKKLDMSDKEIKVLEAMTSAIMNKTLHPVLTYIKKSSIDGKSDIVLKIAKEMFNLEESNEDKNRNKR